MGESAMLLRSFSHPSNASRDAGEGDPLRALTESISFGRFVSEPLAWEKWSTFSHNRYLEEVENFSKPGSVAEKKAFFEAHYKRKAAMKAAASEEGNSAANDGLELKTTCNIHNDFPMDAESTQANSHVTISEQQQHTTNTDNDSSTDIELARKSNVTIDEQWQSDATHSEVADSADANACNSINVRYDSENADLEGHVEYAINVENPTEAGTLKQLQNANVLDKIVAACTENKLTKEAVDQESLSTSIKKTRSSWSLKSSTQSRAAQLPSYSSKQVPSLPPRNVDNITVKCKKSVRGSNEKKRVVPKTLHMSINFSSHASEVSKGSLKKHKDCSTSIQTPIRASVNGVSKHLSKIFQSEHKGSGSKSPRTNGSKPRSSNMSSPFSFRSEERAAKRKEFFQKLEEKRNAKESDKAQVDTRSKIHFIQPRSPKLGGKPMPAAVPDASSRPPKKPSSNTESSIQRADRSTTPSITSVPKLVRKQTPNTVQDASSRPPWRSSMSSASFKHVMGKSNRSATLSVTSLPKKNAHENASPNIQC